MQSEWIYRRHSIGFPELCWTLRFRITFAIPQMNDAKFLSVLKAFKDFRSARKRSPYSTL